MSSCSDATDTTRDYVTTATFYSTRAHQLSSSGCGVGQPCFVQATAGDATSYGIEHGGDSNWYRTALCTVEASSACARSSSHGLDRMTTSASSQRADLATLSVSMKSGHLALRVWGVWWQGESQGGSGLQVPIFAMQAWCNQGLRTSVTFYSARAHQFSATYWLRR